MEENEQKKSFLSKVPGFRSGVLWKKIIAGIGYFFIFLIILGIIIPVPGVEDEVEDARNYIDDKNYKSAISHYNEALDKWEEDEDYPFSKSKIKNELEEAEINYASQLANDIKESVTSGDMEELQSKIEDIKEYEYVQQVWISLSQELVEQTKHFISGEQYQEAKDVAELLVDSAGQSDKEELYQEAEELLDLSDDLANSQEYFDQGLKAMENNEYEKAVSVFEKVSEEDEKNYDNAQEYIEEASQELADDKFEEAQELFEEENYIEAYDKLSKCLSIWPQHSEASSLESEYKNAKEEQERQEEVETYNQLLSEIENEDIDTAIYKLEEYLNQEHPEDLKNEVRKKYNEYRDRYQDIKFKETTGLKVTSITSGWDWYGTFGDRLLVPYLEIKVKNVSDYTKEDITVNVSFINEDENEVFDDDTDYLVGYNEELKPGYSKTAFLRSSVGYKSDTVAINFPNITADIRINDVDYKKVTIEKNYAGVDWD